MNKMEEKRESNVVKTTMSVLLWFSMSAVQYSASRLHSSVEPIEQWRAVIGSHSRFGLNCANDNIQ